MHRKRDILMDENKRDVRSISDDEFENSVLRNDKPVVVEFGADWCGSCHILAPVIKQLLMEFAGGVEYCKIDVDEHDVISKRYGIMDLPTFLFFRDGEVRDHIIGAVPKKVLQKILNRLLN